MDERPLFVNRERELKELRELAESRRPALALLYGRRRVGKTFLLDRAWLDDNPFYFLAADTTSATNRRDLLRELASWSGQELEHEDYPTWRTVFRRFLSIAEQRPFIVVLDEFQYLMGQEDDIISQFVAVWDREARNRPLLVALCGSEISTLERLADGDSPLYGRINWSARLLPFDYWDARAMRAEYSPRDSAYLYGALGGTPRFLSALRPRSRLSKEITRLVLSPRGEVHLQLAHLIDQEKGIRDPAEYLAVLTAVAEGRTETPQIAAAAGLSDRPHVVRRALETLHALQLVRRQRNFAASRRAPWKNRIGDNAVRFWHRFVVPNRSRLETGGVDEVWKSRVRPGLDTYMGKVFEGMCEESFRRFHDHWGLPAAAEWSRWEGQDRNRRSIEIDVVARLEAGTILTGEVKWSSKLVDWDLHLGLLRNLQDLANSGQGWAHRALEPEKSAGHIYFSAAGFTDHFRRKAEEGGNIVLIRLEDIYPAV